MSDIILPRLNQTGSNEWDDVEANDKAIRDVVNGGLDDDNLSGAAGITRANLAALAKPVRWYAPAIIATEQSRTNTAFGLLETPDEIEEVVLPSGGLIIVLYRAHVKSSKDNAGAAAIFLGENEVKDRLGGTGARDDTNGTIYDLAISQSNGLTLIDEIPSDVTTGQALGAAPLMIFADPGTYDVSVRFKATSGSVTAKDRKLFVGVLGATE